MAADDVAAFEIQAGRSGARAGRQSTAEIALELGFADQAHFLRMFKRGVGISPLCCPQLGV